MAHCFVKGSPKPQLHHLGAMQPEQSLPSVALQGPKYMEHPVAASGHPALGSSHPVGPGGDELWVPGGGQIRLGALERLEHSIKSAQPFPKHPLTLGGVDEGGAEGSLHSFQSWLVNT